MTRIVMVGETQFENKRARLLVRVGRRKRWLPTRLFDLLKKLVEADGKYVPTKDLAGSPDDKVHQLVYRLRKEIPGVIVNSPGDGYRISGRGNQM